MEFETKEEVLREARIARAAARYLWEKHQISHRPIIMVVFAMALDEKRTYRQVLKEWAAYEEVKEGHHWTATRWHSEICYRLLKAGAEPERVSDWMRQAAEEVRKLADGISA